MSVLVRLLLVSLLLLCLFGGWFWWQAGQPVVFVQQVTVGPGVVTSSLRMTGQVRSAHVLRLAPGVGGRLQERLPAVGEEVAEGQLLVQLDADEVEAVLRERKLQAEEVAHQCLQSRAHLLRQRQALAEGTGGQQAIRDAEDALQVAQIRLRQAEAAVEVANLQVQARQLRAPMAGVVTAVRATVGEFVTAGQVVLEVAGPGREILVRAEPTDAFSLHAGLAAKVSLEGSPMPPVPEQILRVEPSVRREGTAEHLPVWVSARNPALPLLLNQQVDVNVETAARQVAVRVPLEALVSRNGGNHVWRVSEGRVWLQPVQLGALGDLQAEIRSGLKGGETVALPAGQTLYEGMLVQRQVADGGVSADGKQGRIP